MNPVDILRDIEQCNQYDLGWYDRIVRLNSFRVSSDIPLSSDAWVLVCAVDSDLDGILPVNMWHHHTDPSSQQTAVEAVFAHYREQLTLAKPNLLATIRQRMT